MQKNIGFIFAFSNHSFSCLVWARRTPQLLQKTRPWSSAFSAAETSTFPSPPSSSTSPPRWDRRSASPTATRSTRGARTTLSSWWRSWGSRRTATGSKLEAKKKSKLWILWNAQHIVEIKYQNIHCFNVKTMLKFPKKIVKYTLFNSTYSIFKQEIVLKLAGQA